MLTNILEENTTDARTGMDVVLPMPTIDTSIYLATPTALPSPWMIATVTTARLLMVHFRCSP
uniref:Uncharacterized protein n=1 Tax=Romanomermis culicivorax TaxID=13658 RepID=A0A915JYL9_ROMCU